jgi:hypothetical protein
MKKIKRWWYHKQMRRAAKKHNLDFEQRCCFREQVVRIGIGLEHGTGEIVKIPMESGRLGLYKVTSRRVDHSADDTGQRHWKYEFQGYEGDM